MRRREFVKLAGAVAGAWSLPVRAQRAFAYRVGHLAIAAPTDVPRPPPANWEAFVQGLRDAGYREGENIAFEHRSAHDKPELFRELAMDLASLNVNAIFARGSWALLAAKNATGTIPIVGIDLEIDPVEAGLVSSIARPGGNVTGLFLDLSELSGKHLQILKEIFPKIARVGVIGSANVNASQLRELDKVAQVGCRLWRLTSQQIRAWKVSSLAPNSGVPTLSLFFPTHSTSRTGFESRSWRLAHIYPRCICTGLTWTLEA